MSSRTFLAAALATLLLPTATAAASPWQRIGAAVPAGAKVAVAPDRFAAFALDRAAVDRALAAAPAEGSPAPATVSVPAPDGRLERFAITDSPVMEDALAHAHPEIRTFAGRGIDDRTATIRLDSTPLGFHAAVRSEHGAWYVDPRYVGDTLHYVSYDRSALTRSPNADFLERDLLAPDDDPAVAPQALDRPGQPVKLRTYRLALVTDPTYAANSGAAAGLDRSDPLYASKLNARVTAAKAVLMNRVNQVYEQDFAARMVLINATDRLNLNTPAHATGANGPCGAQACFTADQISSCGSSTLDRNVFVTGLLAGARNFDIGHIGLGTNGGGIAALGVVGDSNKAQGCTGIPKPIGDYYAIDYVAHEMGHEYGGDHTFNGTQLNCSLTNRNVFGDTTVEPGSGSSVMAYAGVCGQDDLQPHSDPYFSEASIPEMGPYIGSARTPAPPGPPD